MRVISWNMAYWKPATYKSVENRRRQWALLAALNPDVALLQECRPEDLHANAPPWMAERFQIHGAIPERWTACSAVLVNRELEPEGLSLDSLPADELAWLQYLDGYLAYATALVNGIRTALISVHAIAKEVTDESLAAANPSRARRTQLTVPWHCDLAAAGVQPLVQGRPFVVGGDWNTARLFDENYYDQFGSTSTAFFGELRRHGWHETLRATYPQEVRTYLDEKSGPYELDHVFTDASLAALSPRAHVVDIADHAITRELSDHAPLVVDFPLPSPVVGS